MSRQPCNARRAGFSLIEVIVVVAILAVLLGIMLTAVQTIRQTARRTECLNNLHQLGIAFLHQRTTAPGQFATSMWRTTLTPYVENSDKVFRCPVAKNGGSGIGDAPAYIHIKGPPGYPEFNNTTYVPIDLNGPRRRASTRVPNPNPGGQVIEFELTPNSNNDYDDLVILVLPQGDGTLQITYALGDGGGTSNFGGWSYDLVDANFNVIISNFKHGDSSKAAAASNYGINAAVPRFVGGDSAKLLLVEYHKSVADVVGPNAGDKSNWPTLCAPRHFNRMNVLYYDGHTGTVSPDDIDPRVSDLHDTYWLPKMGLTP